MTAAPNKMTTSTVINVAAELLPPERPLFALLDEMPWINALRFALATPIIIGHSLIVFVILRNRRLRDSHCNMTIATLSVSDILVGLGIFARAAYAMHASAHDIVHFERCVCARVNYAQGLGLAIGRVAVVAVGMERFLALHRPMAYRARNKWPYLLALALASTASSSIYTLSVFGGMDNTVRIEICSMGSAAGRNHIVLTNLLSYVTLGMLIGVYIGSLVLFTRRSSNSTKIGAVRLSGLQRRITTTVLVLLSVYIFFWLIVPVALYAAKFAANSRLAAGYVTYSVGFLTGINSLASLYVYLSRHEEISRHVRLTLGWSINGRKSTRSTSTVVAAPSNFLASPGRRLYTTRSSPPIV